MMHSIIMRSKRRRFFTGIAVLLFWLLVWQILYMRVAQEILLVSPVHVSKRLFSLVAERAFWHSISMSALRVIIGFFVAVAVGIPLAVITFRWNILHSLFAPLLNVVRSTPVASFIILALVWMRRDWVPVFIVFLMVLPMIWANVYTGIAQADRNLLEMATVFRLSRMKKLVGIYIPSTMPYFMTACSTGLGFAWKSAIAAEVIALPRIAIGKEIYNAKIYLETVDLFAWTLAVIAISVLLERFTIYFLHRLQAVLGKGEVRW